MRKITFCWLLSGMLLLACNDDRNKCSFKYTDVENSQYQVDGCFVDSVEDGVWRKYSSNKLIEEGQFDKGLRTGVWRYWVNSGTDSLQWKPYTNNVLGVSTNIPVSFALVEEGDNYIKWKIGDTAKLVTVVIMLHDLRQLQVGADSFYRLYQTELEGMGWTFNSQINKVSAKDRTYFFSLYQADGKEKGKFEALHCYAAISTNKLAEINVRFDRSQNMLARNVFVSLISNLFIDAIRFINPYTTIEVSKP